MCGITGFWAADGLDADPAGHLAAMMQTLVHRGPDGHGTYVDRTRGIVLGHQRLSINDLGDTGRQPLASRDGRIQLVVNGEFYDFKRYRPLLMAQGDRFESTCDSEIAIQLYQRFGLDFLDHLRGEFAIALYDAGRDELLLVRDRFGIRPMFYHATESFLAFGSEAKAVLAHPKVPRRLSRRAALNQLMQTMVPGTSAFEDVHALLPGHLLRVRRDGHRFDIETHRYWDLTFQPSQAYADAAPAEYFIEQVREELVQAIRLRLEADVPVGCYLSGGIDSCSILGLATGAQQSPVKAFTISFDHEAYDEAAIAVEMAESMGADQDIIRLGADDLYGRTYPTAVWHAERTFYNTLGVAKWWMSHRVHECGYKTVITGEGADELFGGYPAFKRDMFLHGLAGEPESVRREYEAALDRSNRLFKGAILAEEPQSHPAWQDLCGFTPAWLQPWIATLAEVRPLLSRDARDELADYDPVLAIAETIDPDQIRDRHPLDIAQYTWVKTMLEGQILNWGGDRMDMANAMESRPAFLDHHVAELATTIPPRLRIKGNIEKWVLREAVRGVLPQTLYEREKFAFMAPPAHTDALKRARSERLIATYLAHETVQEAGMLEPAAVRRFLDAYRRDEDPISLVRRDKVLNHLLCLHILHRQFIAGQQAPIVAEAIT